MLDALVVAVDDHAQTLIQADLGSAVEGGADGIGVRGTRSQQEDVGPRKRGHGIEMLEHARLDRIRGRVDDEAVVNIHRRAFLQIESASDAFFLGGHTYQGEGRLVENSPPHAVYRLGVARQADVGHQTLERTTLQGGNGLGLGRGDGGLDLAAMKVDLAHLAT